MEKKNKPKMQHQMGPGQMGGGGKKIRIRA